MVSINTFNNTERIDRLNQSIDYAIRNLLDGHKDPLSIAVYLHTFTKHRISSINADRLADWGIAWIRKIFVENDIGRRQDEEIAAASLAISSISETSSFKVIKDEVADNFKKILSKEIDQNKIPLRNPIYGAMLLLAAYKLGVEESLVQETAHRTGEKFVELVSGGRLFGLFLGIELLQINKDTESIAFVEEAIKSTINSHNTTYEDQIYLLQSLWQIHSQAAPNASIMEITENVLKKSPAWQYLMNGMEDISPAGDGQAIVFLSHLFRSSLLDVLKNYQSNESAYNEAQIDARYTVRAGVSWSAFGFYILAFLVAWAVLLCPLVKYGDRAIKYWFLGNYSEMSKSHALLYLLGINLLIYLGIVTVKMLPMLYKIFIKSQIGSDKRIKEYLLPQFWGATKIWLGILAVEILLGIFVELIIPSFQHTIGKPN